MATQSAHFNGSNQDATSTGSSLKISGAAFSIEGWFKSTSASAFQSLGHEHRTVGNTVAFAGWLSDTGSGKINFQTDFGSPQETAATSAYSANVWTHFAITWDGSNARYYINGVLDATVSQTGTLVATNDDKFYLASDGNVAGFFSGNRFLVRVWSTVRTLTEISSNMCTPLGSTTGLQGEWILDGDFVDNSGNGNTLTGVNSPTFQSDIPSACAVAIPTGSFLPFM